MDNIASRAKSKRAFSTVGAAMKNRSSLVFFASLLVLCLPSWAEQVWLAEGMLAAVSSPVIIVKNKDGQETDRIDRAGLERSLQVLRRLAPAYDLQPPPLYVISGASPNAFATTAKDGSPVVAINTAMLKLAGGDESELAVVLGHELGHLKAKHTTEGVQRARGISLLGALLGAAVDLNAAKHGRNTAGLGATVGAAGSNLANAKFSRDQEREADQLGITAMARAGFDPATAGRFWAKMARAGGGGSGTWFDSHPSSTDREETLASLARDLQPVFAARTEAAPRSDPDPYPRSAYASLEPSESELGAQTDYAKGRAAFKEKRFVEAASLLRAAADAGDERAATLLGAQAQFGLGREANFDEARTYFERAASKGFGRALSALADMSMLGKGKVQDASEAARFYALADARDDSHAAAQLAVLYASGRGVSKDALVARRYADKSAAAGDKLGQAVLASMVRDGVGGSRDVVRGTDDLAKVAPEVPWARYQLGLSYEQGLGVVQDKARAREHYELAVKAGVAAAQERLRLLSQP
jgi:predicted Zn-dependent protease